MRQAVEGGDEQTGDEEHQEAEGDLHGDQRMHEAAARVRIVAAFECAGRLDGGGAQRRRQTEQQRHGEGQRQAECRARASPREERGAPDCRAD